jgi:hypothetical protein
MIHPGINLPEQDRFVKVEKIWLFRVWREELPNLGPFPFKLEDPNPANNSAPAISSRARAKVAPRPSL